MKTHLPVILYWAFFIIGQCLYVLLKAWRVVTSPKSPTIPTYSAYFGRYWIPLVARVFAASCLFILVQAGSGSFTSSFAPDLFSNVKSCGLSGLCGLGTDALLEKFTDKVPFFKNFLPDANGNGNTEDQAKGQGAGG